MAGDETVLGNVAEVIMGQSPPGSTYNEVGYGLPFFQGVRDFNYRYPTVRVFCSAPSRIAQPGDILFSVRAPIERVNIADRECCIGRGLSIIRARSETDARYIEFVLRLLEPSWHTIEGSGSVFGNATRSDLESLSIPWPSPVDRQAIACILGTLDDKIELNRRMSETLEAMAQALFKAWFVDFEPVRAKMEGRWRRGESLPGLPAHLYELFPDRLVDSELGEIPEGWEVGKLGDVLVQSIDPCSPSDETRTRQYVPIECIAARSLLLADSKPGEEAQSSLTRFRKGDLLFGAMRPYFHKVAIAPFDGTTRTTVFVLQPCQADDFSFATLLLHDAKTIEYATNHSIGSTIPYAVWQGSLESMPIILPPAAVRKSFDKITRPLLDRVPPFFFANRTLAALRDALLPKLIRGEIRVKDAERFLQERGL